MVEIKIQLSNFKCLYNSYIFIYRCTFFFALVILAWNCNFRWRWKEMEEKKGEQSVREAWATPDSQELKWTEPVLEFIIFYYVFLIWERTDKKIIWWDLFNTSLFLKCFEWTKKSSFCVAYTGNFITMSLNTGLSVARSVIPKVKFTVLWRDLRKSHRSDAEQVLLQRRGVKKRGDLESHDG